MLWLVLIPAALALAGLVLLALGIRGRTIDTHPHCRRCGFDLIGHVSASDDWTARVCPECGQDLTNPHARRTGLRRARRGLVLGAAPLLLVVGLAGGAFMWTVARGPSAYRHLPTGILTRLIDWTPHTQEDAVLTELETRQALGFLSTEQRQMLVTSALRRQADLKKPWNERFGRFIELERSAGTLSGSDWTAYLSLAEEVEWIVRPRIEVGAPLPMEATLGNRLGRTGDLHIRVALVDVLIDGVRVDGNRHELEDTPTTGRVFPASAVPNRMQTCASTFCRFSWIPGGECETRWNDVPIHCPPGTHTVETTWGVVVGSTPIAATGSSWMRSGVPPDTDISTRAADDDVLLQLKHRFSTHIAFISPGQDTIGPEERPELAGLQAKLFRRKTTFEVLPPDTQNARIITPQLDGSGRTISLTVQCAEQPSSVPWTGGPPASTLLLRLTCHAPSPAVAGDLAEITAAGESPVGSIALEPLPQSPTTFSSQSVSVPLPLRADWKTPRTFVFRASQNAAKRLVHGAEIVGPVIVFHDVPSPDFEKRGEQRGTMGKLAVPQSKPLKMGRWTATDLKTAARTRPTRKKQRPA